MRTTIEGKTTICIHTTFSAFHDFCVDMCQFCIAFIQLSETSKGFYNKDALPQRGEKTASRKMKCRMLMRNELPYMSRKPSLGNGKCKFGMRGIFLGATNKMDHAYCRCGIFFSSHFGANKRKNSQHIVF